ncbi:hypothetical protein NDU88_003981, partial [Pleurodeles waltl]
IWNNIPFSIRPALTLLHLESIPLQGALNQMRQSTLDLPSIIIYSQRPCYLLSTLFVS